MNKATFYLSPINTRNALASEIHGISNRDRKNNSSPSLLVFSSSILIKGAKDFLGIDGISGGAPIFAASKKAR
jgi:hypothetical protein